jgi:hypothetical protein
MKFVLIQLSQSVLISQICLAVISKLNRYIISFEVPHSYLKGNLIHDTGVF